MYNVKIKFISLSQFVIEIENINIFIGQDIDDITRLREDMNF